MTLDEIRKMTDEELLKLSKEKNSRGRYSADANRAMKVRRERSGKEYWLGISRSAPSFERMEVLYNGAYMSD